jgi:hypothetical protein
MVQQWVNNAIVPQQADPAQFDAWSIFPRERNCNDYAVTKRHILLESGWPASSLLLAVVRLIANGEHHLILIVKDASGDWVLDNLRPFVVRLAVTRNDYVWERVQSIRDPGYGRNRSGAWAEPVVAAGPFARHANLAAADCYGVEAGSPSETISIVGSHSMADIGTVLVKIADRSV